MRAQSAGPVSQTGHGGSIDKGNVGSVALPDLAVQINAEHAAAMEHARSAVQRARHAGELLLQAKEQCAHGEWLPWLRSHCPDISERTVQSYMRLARHCLDNPEQANEIESFTLRNALAQLAAPTEKRNTVADLPDSGAETVFSDGESLLNEIFGGDIEAFATHLLERPFCDYDVQVTPRWVQWFQAKLLHKLKLPALASFALSVDSGSIPILRVVPADELSDALKKLVPIATGKGSLPSMAGSIKAAGNIMHGMQVIAARLCGEVLIECEHRDGIDDETYFAEYQDVSQRFLALQEARLEALTEVKARRDNGALADNDEYLSALDRAQRLEAVKCRAP